MAKIEVDEDEYTQLKQLVCSLRQEIAELDIDANVRQFHRAMGQEVRDVPSVPDEKVVRLRARLVTEECLKMFRALFDVNSARDNSNIGYSFLMSRIEAYLKTIIDDADIDVSMPELADALADIDYVVSGTRAAFGIDGRPIATAVHAANLAKASGPRREDGKILKPAGWRPPDIEGELRKQGWDDAEMAVIDGQ